jgi:glucose-1-phosphate cytidylyltransferase
MKTVILAGGFGTRLSEETILKPKPMVEIGGKPILWHVMKIYSLYGFNEFFIALGYKGELIKNYFLEYYYFQRDLTIHLGQGKTDVHEESVEEENRSDDWVAHLVDTGLDTLTDGRVKRLSSQLNKERSC